MVPLVSSTVGPAVRPPLSVFAIFIFAKVIGKGINGSYKALLITVLMEQYLG